jgi:hypothetical protein
MLRKQTREQSDVSSGIGHNGPRQGARRTLSANAAAIEAGFRKQTTALQKILKLLPKLTPSERRQLRARLDEAMKVCAA